MVFLEQSQTHFKSLGYCWYDKDQRLPKDGRAAKINAVISLFLIWVAIVSLEYFFDSENPRNDRMFVIIAFLGFLELDGAHFTFSNKKTKLYHFFEHFQSVITKSMSVFDSIQQKKMCVIFYFLRRLMWTVSFIIHRNHKEQGCHRILHDCRTKSDCNKTLCFNFHIFVVWATANCVHIVQHYCKNHFGKMSKWSSDLVHPHEYEV